jgi:SAM-dependent methyltransferase
MTPQSSTSRRVVRDYYRTTSGGSIDPAATERSREVSLRGLRRRLGSWLEVSGKDVIDLGCGTGELCELAMRGGARSVVGVNLSEEEIAFARSGCGAQFVGEDIATYLRRQPDASCDAIFALNILEHLDKDTLGCVLDDCRRVLREGGYLVAIVPNATSPFGAMTRYWDITHENAFTPSSLRQLARLCGFAGTEFRECGPVVHGVVSAVRYLLWQCIRALIWSYLMVELASSKGGIYTADLLARFHKGEST